MLAEQIAEGERAKNPYDAPLLPATYDYLKRLDHDLGLFGDDK